MEYNCRKNTTTKQTHRDHAGVFKWFGSVISETIIGRCMQASKCFQIESDGFLLGASDLYVLHSQYKQK